MDKIFLDTDVFSYCYLDDRRKSDECEEYRALIDDLDQALFYISRQVHTELLYYGLSRNWSQLRFENLHRLFKKFVIVDTDQEIGSLHAELRRKAEKVGRPMMTSDLWTLATASRLGQPLITNDSDYFWDHGVQVITLNEKWKGC